ncbi:MAG: ABC transporter ATP-binding protein [Myxococcota bacterium]
MDAPILRAEGLVKSYGGRRVVDGLSFTCREGSVLGLLGPNGAGKTTTLRMLYGFITPEAGRIHYAGRDFGAQRTDLKRMIGVCTQDDTLDPDFTVVQNLRVYAGYFRPRVRNVGARIDELLERFGLRPYADHSPDQLSGGYRKRLLIARSIVHRPRVLFLDEPTTGLDPRARVDVWELVDAMRSEGMAVILTTHYMDEAQRLSDDLVVLEGGREVVQGRPGEVLGRLLGEHVLVVPATEPQRPAIRAWLGDELGKRPSVVLGELRVPLGGHELALFSEQFRDALFEVRPPNLDDLFLELSVERT